MSDNFTLDCHVENDRVCRFAALVALAIAAWHVTLGGQAAATEVDALGAPAPVESPTLLEGQAGCRWRPGEDRGGGPAQMSRGKKCPFCSRVSVRSFLPQIRHSASGKTCT